MTTHFLYRLNFPNGKSYYGITNDLAKRFREHKRDARGKSPYPVHAAMRKYGVENVTIEALARGSRELVAMLEITCIAAAGAYNVLRGGDVCPMLGQKHSDETREKMSRSHKGRKQSPEHVARLAEARRGGTRSAESRQRMSDGQKARIRTPEELARMSEVAKRRVMTPEYREKLRVAALARWARRRTVIPE